MSYRLPPDHLEKPPPPPRPPLRDTDLEEVRDHWHSMTRSNRKEADPMGHRLANLYVTPEAVKLFLMKGAYAVVDTEVPEDARVYSAAWDAGRGAFVLTLESVHFDEVYAGSIIPELRGATIKRLEGPVERYL